MTPDCTQLCYEVAERSLRSDLEEHLAREWPPDILTLSRAHAGMFVSCEHLEEGARGHLREPLINDPLELGQTYRVLARTTELYGVRAEEEGTADSRRSFFACLMGASYQIHTCVVQIQPFRYGNEALARLAVNWLLLSYGFKGVGGSLPLSLARCEDARYRECLRTGSLDLFTSYLWQRIADAPEPDLIYHH